MSAGPAWILLILVARKMSENRLGFNVNPPVPGNGLWRKRAGGQSVAETIRDLAAQVDPHRHVLIAGPTASGKSALALALAEAQGGTIVNADALCQLADSERATR